MRVLTIGNQFPPVSTGGYERTWLSVLAALRDEGHEARVLTTGPPLPDDPPDVERSLRWWWDDGRWRRPWPGETRRVERHTAAVLDRALAWPDVVCLFGLGGMPLSLVGRARRVRPVVGVVGDAWMVYGREKDPNARRHGVDLSSVRWLFNSAWTRRVSGQDGELVHPGVDPAVFAPVEPGPWAGRLLVAGREAPGKGVEVARAAAGRLPGCTLTVASEVPQADMPAVYAACDALLFPVTWDEPWGLVPLEAMAVGRPVIATGTGGSAEYLRDGENALLVARGDPDALAGAVRRLAGDPTLRGRLIAGGHATAARFPAAAHDRAIVAAIADAAPGGVTSGD